MSDAIATIGPAGVRFRSRLEARWAGLFDLMRLPWQYEPELDLNRWIPDFALTLGTGMLVEVKPAVTLTQLEPHKARIENSGAIAPVWLVGAALTLGGPLDDPALGLFGFCGMGTTWLWREMTVTNLGEQTSQPVPPFNVARRFGLLQRAWIKAGNDRQWRKG